MDAPPDFPDPAQAEIHFRAMLSEGDIAQPDDVEYDPAANELIFFWHEPKLAVVLELDSNEPVEVFSRAGVQPPV